MTGREGTSTPLAWRARLAGVPTGRGINSLGTWWLAPVFLVAAIAYSMVGMGGGSAYLAIFLLANLAEETVPPEFIPKIVLVCNLIVACISAIQFRRAGYFSARLVLPLLATALPAAFIVTFFAVPVELFTIAAAILLLLSGCRMLIDIDTEGLPIEHVPAGRLWLVGLQLGLVLGLLVGTMGVGAGVLLVPMLALLRWGTAKQSAATVAVFILATSLAALWGQLWNSPDFYELGAYLWVYPVVFAGALIGSTLGARRMAAAPLRLLSAILVLSVSGMLFYRLFYAAIASSL